MNEYMCRGLRGSWVNGWLAAVGATVLEPSLRLHWTADGEPTAVLSSCEEDAVGALAASWPRHDLLSDLPIAVQWCNDPPLKRNATVDHFAQRARASRAHPHAWSLSSTMTDLAMERPPPTDRRRGEAAHAPFDPPAPKGMCLHDRVLSVHGKVGEPVEEIVRRSLDGVARRQQDNGLGFDLARIGSMADETKPYVDPVIELLAFFGLSILPMRGSGVDGSRGDHKRQQRGWRRLAGDKERRFTWPAWRQPLDVHSIDALLDIWEPGRKRSWQRVGVLAGWRSVWYEPKGSEATKAIGSEPL